MTQGSALRSPRPTRYVNVEPRLQLLVLLEPRYRVFFRNLFDLVLRRKVPPFFLASQPAQCSRNYYVRTGVRWQAVAESLAWHLAATPLLLMVWTWSMQWDSMSYPLHQAHISHGKYQLTYYKPGETFPARDGRQHQKIKPQQHAPSEPPAIHVASEQQRLGVAAPDVPLTGNVQAEIASADPTLPAVPLSATARSQLTLPANYSEAVAPSPGTGRLSMRALGSLGAAVVAPVPQIASIRGSGGVSLPEAVVSPAPTLRGSSRRGGMGNNEIGSVTVVRPSPQLAGGVARGSRLSREFGIGGIGTLAAAIVPPPPSISGRAFVPGGSGNSLNGAGVQVVAPSPALAHGVVLASGRGDSLRGSGAQVVPPAPALRGHAFRAGSAGGSSSHSGGVQVVGPYPSLGSGVVLARSSGHSLGGDGTQVVPPAPSLAGTGGFAGAGGNGSSGAIVGAVVPPAPSVGGIAIQAGNGGGGGFGSLTGDGTQVVAPAPAIASSRVFAAWRQWRNRVIGFRVAGTAARKWRWWAGNRYRQVRRKFQRFCWLGIGPRWQPPRSKLRGRFKYTNDSRSVRRSVRRRCWSAKRTTLHADHQRRHSEAPRNPGLPGREDRSIAFAGSSTGISSTDEFLLLKLRGLRG